MAGKALGDAEKGSANRKSSKEVTKDRVFIPTWEEGSKARKDLELDKVEGSHWSRTPLERLGLAVLDLRDQKKISNSGAYCAWRITPFVSIRASVGTSGTGSKTSPRVVASLAAV